jgi:hypothetical protein
MKYLNLLIMLPLVWAIAYFITPIVGFMLTLANVIDAGPHTRWGVFVALGLLFSLAAMGGLQPTIDKQHTS